MHHLIIPGLNNSGPKHWQSFWERSLPDTERVVQKNWEHPEKNDWVERLSGYIAGLKSDTVLVAHSLGSVTAVEWLLREKSPFVRGAFLVAPADADSVETIRDFAPVPLKRLPVPSMVVASENDPYVSMERARLFAEAWGSSLENVGALGHINAQTDLGEWPAGRALLEKFERSLE